MATEHLSRTEAEKISARFGDDGLRYEDDDGISIFDACQGASRDVVQNWERGTTRYIFADDSAITICGAAWDLGYADCSCWVGGGHEEKYCERITRGE